MAKKTGRPRAENPKTTQICLRCTNAERDAWTRHAREWGMSLSKYLRLALESAIADDELVKAPAPQSTESLGDVIDKYA